MPTGWNEFQNWLNGPEWGGRYAAVFNLTALPSLPGMLAAWAREWFVIGYTPAELTAALDAVIRERPPDKLDAHFAAITRALQAGRAAARAPGAWGGEPSGPAVCTACGGSGMIGDLPLPRDVVDGQWDGRYTCAVLCRCSRGVALGQAFAARQWASDWLRRRALRTIDDYYRVVPEWLVEQLHAAKRARRQSEVATRRAERDRERLPPGVRRAAAVVAQAVQQAAEANGDGEGEIPF